MKHLIFSLLILAFFLNSCKFKNGKNQKNQIESDSIAFSFSFIGCNRVDKKDLKNINATDGSSANIYALKRILNEISDESRKPDVLFFLGDLVNGTSTTEILDKQLKQWKKNIQDKTFSKIAKLDIEIVAVPGNHEMLTLKNCGIPHHNEFPLENAQNIWSKYMGVYMPKDREFISGKDSIINQSTFSFTRQKNAFIVMNTDSYNTNIEEHPCGQEGFIPIEWVTSQIKKYRSNPDITNIFVLGHRPYYIFDIPFTSHYGLLQGEELWKSMIDNKVNSMLSSHFHDYQRMQPNFFEEKNRGPYQVIAGNGGSSGFSSFFGYTTINIMSNGEVKLISKGFDVGTPYYSAPVKKEFTVRDTTTLTWERNKNPYNNLLNLDWNILEEEIESKLRQKIKKAEHILEK